MLKTVQFRTVVVIAVFVGAWVVAQVWAPTYAAVPIAAVAAAIVVWVVGRFAPRAIEGGGHSSRASDSGAGHRAPFRWLVTSARR